MTNRTFTYNGMEITFIYVGKNRGDMTSVRMVFRNDAGKLRYHDVIINRMLIEFDKDFDNWAQELCNRIINLPIHKHS